MVVFLSHSVWSAWIEISVFTVNTSGLLLSHSVWSAWIEITAFVSPDTHNQGRTPFGVRG